MPQLDFVAAFYGQRFTHTSLLAGMEGLLSSRYCREVRALPFYCPGCSLWWEARPPHASPRTTLLRRDEGISLFDVSTRYTEKGHDKEVSGRVFLYEHPGFPGVHVVMTAGQSELFRRALRPFIDRNYPRALTTFISHRKLRKLLDQFIADEHLTDVRIKRASVRVRSGDTEGKKRVIPLVAWPDMTLDEAFDWVSQQNGWFQSLQFEVHRQGLVGSLSFSREGELRTDSVFRAAFLHFIEPVCKTLHDNVRFFQRRSRQDNEAGIVRPLVIDFETQQFETVDENQRFIGAMRRFPRASVSVLHGNPYIHLSVLDYYDGSSFDVWVVDSSSIVIVPQFRGSVSAIKRLINHVFDTYAEGRIKDYQETEG